MVFLIFCYDKLQKCTDEALIRLTNGMHSRRNCHFWWKNSFWIQANRTRIKQKKKKKSHLDMFISDKWIRIPVAISHSFKLKSLNALLLNMLRQHFGFSIVILCSSNRKILTRAVQICIRWRECLLFFIFFIIPIQFIKYVYTIFALFSILLCFFFHRHLVECEL